MWRGEADALDAVDARDHAQQGAEVHIIKAIRIYGLSEQHHLADSVISQACDLAEQIFRRYAALAPANVRHDAKCAELVASAHRGDVGADTFGMRRGNIGVGLRAIQAHINLGIE